MGKISRGDASVLKEALPIWLEEPVLVEPCLEKAPFEEFCGDIVMGRLPLVLDLLTPFVLSYTTRRSFHPPHFPPPHLMCMHFMSP